MNLHALPDPAAVERERLKALYDFAVLDTLPEARFDRLTGLAAALFDAPIAAVSLIDEQRQWFKSSIGLDVSETHRDLAFCAHAIQGETNSTFVVPDATTDPRFNTNPLVTADPSIRFYAGATLTTAEGYNIGSLCVIDRKPRRKPSAADLKRLSVIAQMVVDQFELGRATAALNEQRRLLALAESMSGVGHWRYEVATGDIFWSEEVYRIHGVDSATFNPRLGPGIAFYHADDQAMVAAFMEKAVALGQEFNFQARLFRPDGKLRHVTSRAATERNDKGAVVAVIGVYQDITDEVENLAVINESRVRYRLLTENANDMVTDMDQTGVFTYVSPSIKALTGYTPSEAVGRQAMDFIVPEDKARVARAFAEATAERKGWTIEYRVKRKDGAVIWVEARPSLTIDSQTGEPTGVTDVIRDVTDRKAMEAELERARAEAVEAAAVKGEFLANMSHELRTPLTSIIGFSDLLHNMPSLDDEARRYVGRVSDSSHALLTVVNDVLDFSKLEAGQVAIEPRAVDARPLFSGVLGMVGPQAEAKGLALTLDLASLPKTLKLDDARLRQVLLNLLSNAIKFTETGEVTLRARYDKTRRRLRCEVLDTGPGIPADRLDRLFRRFSQVDGSIARSHGGTGLGLAICKGLVEAMGGQVGAASILGQGSRFWFDIACEPAGAPTVAASEAIDSAQALKGLRVLVVDDKKINRELMRLILGPFGVEVTDLTTGAEAVASTAVYDVILMDLRMPDMDGFQAAQAIRNGDGPNAHARIIAFTAEAGDLHGEGLFDDHLAKPLIAADALKLLSIWAAAGAGDDSRQALERLR